VKYKLIVETVVSLCMFSGGVLAFNGNGLSSSGMDWTLAKGTTIPVEAVNSIYSQNCIKGQKVIFKIKKDILSENEVIIPANTIVEGVVTKVKKAGPWGKPGEIDLGFSEIDIKSGPVIPVTGSLVVKRHNANFFVRYSLMGVFIRGKNAEIKKGTEVDLDVTKTVSSPAEHKYTASNVVLSESSMKEEIQK